MMMANQSTSMVVHLWPGCLGKVFTRIQENIWVGSKMDGYLIEMGTGFSLLKTRLVDLLVLPEPLDQREGLEAHARPAEREKQDRLVPHEVPLGRD
jgi:hypothetical protein